MDLKIFIQIPPWLSKRYILEFTIMIHKNTGTCHIHCDDAILIINGHVEVIAWIVFQKRIKVMMNEIIHNLDTTFKIFQNLG